jgi:hypothetical protein
MEIQETTKRLDRSNIAEMPNPKPIHVEKVAVTTPGQDGKNGNTTEYGYITNANLSPDALIGRG